ncbi:MAG TPA: DUF1329 domain-containing protein [Candidatus Binataceae bacterium]|nr:DUF1329 domain-containing protein [Candidatus Binataceae bacterium]
MKVTVRSLLFVVLFSSLLAVSSAFAQGAGEGGIPDGTIITLQNWQQYQQYIPGGMQELFKGHYFWKLPPDYQMVVGPTHHYHPPKTFEDYTEKYSGQVRISNASDGRHLLTGYVSGWPFPNPTEPMKGWKILVNLWYAYNPMMVCTPHARLYFQDRYHNSTNETFIEVYRKLDHIGDAGYPITNPSSQGVQFVEYLQITQPEQARYTAQITLYYDDFSKEEDLFLFVPSLRRSLRLSSAARCSPIIGSDYSQDEARPTLFNTTPARFDATLLADNQTLGLTDSDASRYGVIDNFYPQVLIPKPIVGKWELRPTFVLDTRRIPSQAKGYCYGKKIMWVDKEAYSTLWEDLYDENMKLWKTAYVCPIAAPVPGEGVQVFSWQLFSVMYDMQADHLSMYNSSFPATKTNDNCKNYDGEDYTNVNRYSKVSALNEIMR